MFVYKQLHPAAAIICAVATLMIAPDAATIPIPSPMTPTKIVPAGNMPEPAVNTPESAGNMPEPTVKLGSWHEIVIAKPAIMTASPAITISHPAIRINIISTHAARLSAFAAWVEMVMMVMAVAPLTAYVYPLS